MRSHHDDYSVVLGYAATPKVEEIRHAYLHVRLNNYAASAAFKVKGRAESHGASSTVPSGVQREFASNFDNMLIGIGGSGRGASAGSHAARPRPKRRSRASIDPACCCCRTSTSRCRLTKPGDNPFRDEIVTLATAVDVGKEKARFQRRFDSIPVPQKRSRCAQKCP